MRLTQEELEKVKEKYGVEQLWSFSKFDTYRTSQFEWMLKYIQKKPENNEKISAYGNLGNAVHSCLEEYYKGDLKYEDLVQQFINAFTVNIDMLGMYFDKNDEYRNESIKNKYYQDIIHYFSNFTPIEYKTQIEQFIAIKITDDIIFQGYIDCIHKDNNDNYIITDFKTSSYYSLKSLKEHSAQLVLYAEGLRQKGIPDDKIKCRFIFLKYVDIDCEQANGNIKTRSIERCKIGESLQSSCKMWLKKHGYGEEETQYFLLQLMETNDIKCLPEDIQKKYIVRDAELYVNDVWKFYEELKEEIIYTINEINNKVIQYNLLKDSDINSAERLFWDSDESLKAQSYYYNNLCGYSISTMKPYKLYLNKLEAEKNGNIFGSQQDTDSNEYSLDWLKNL